MTNLCTWKTQTEFAQLSLFDGMYMFQSRIQWTVVSNTTSVVVITYICLTLAEQQPVSRLTFDTVYVVGHCSLITGWCTRFQLNYYLHYQRLSLIAINNLLVTNFASRISPTSDLKSDCVLETASLAIQNS